MESRRPLSKSEAQALDAVMASLSERAQQPLSLNKLLRQWSELVMQVERGYRASIYEYINDLSARDILEEISHQLPQSLCEELLKLIKPWDERFNKATREVARPLSHGIKQNVTFHWWFRVPLRLSQQLEADLRSEGILE